MTALEHLCGPEAVSRLKGAVEELNTRDRWSFLRGYRLAVATPLNELLSFVVGHAEQLGWHRWHSADTVGRVGQARGAIP